MGMASYIIARIDDVRKKPTSRKTSKDNMVDLEFYADNGHGPFVLANYAQEHIADEIIEAFDQFDGYRNLISAVSDLCVELNGDGFYGNDPIELVGNIRNRLEEKGVLWQPRREATCSSHLTKRPLGN